MKKFGKILIVVALVIAAFVGLFYSTNTTKKTTRTAFELGGYVIVANKNAESEKIYFENDVAYGLSSTDEITFNDIQNKEYSVAEDTFFHFDGDYVSCLVEGVFMDLSETGNDYITYYHTDPGMLIETGNTVTLTTDSDKYNFDSILWKLNDDRYIILGGNLVANFGKDDLRNCGNYVELHYLDRGVVQIITEDNVWQTASPTVYIETANKIEIYPILEQMINGTTGRESFMNSLVVNADDNMHMRNAQEKNVNNIIPHFNIITTDGKDGDSGDIGADGKKGQDGPWGVDAGTTSSSKTEIPTMYVTNWHHSATTIWGVITTFDSSSVLEPDSFVSGDTVYVTEVGSSTKYPVVPTKKPKWDVEDSKFDNLYDEDEQYFKLDPSIQLKPDTEYAFVVRGQYSMGDYDTTSKEGANTDSKMYRDFIYRTFYTNSLGVSLSKEGATTSTISIKTTKQDYSLAEKITVFLLTEEQNKDFTEEIALNEVAGSSGYYMMASEVYDTSIEGTIEKTVDFGAVNSGQTLNSDTTYIARVLVTYIEGGDEVSKLSSQECQVKTLKITPTIAGYPEVASNRVAKRFEIYSAKVDDPDGAITAYYYDIYDNQMTSSGSSLIKTIKIEPNIFESSDYITLDIDDVNICFNHTYYLTQRVEYNDNEKDVSLEKNTEHTIIYSPTFIMSGSQLPSVTFRYLVDEKGNKIGQQYDRIQGWIVISKNGSDIKFDTSDPIVVSMEAEGIFSKQMKFTNEDVVDNGNELLIYLDENYLYRDTIYRLTVAASVDVNEDGDTEKSIYTSRILGNIVVNTERIPVLKAVWATTDGDYRISRKLTLVANTAGEDITYLSNTLSSMTIDLYSGAYGSGFKITSLPLKDLNEDEYVSTLTNDLFIDGLPLNEGEFGIDPASLTATSYSFVITSCYDYTYETAAGGGNSGNISHYVNEIEIMNYDSGTIGTQQLPPALPAYGLEDTCVTATELTKKNAISRYGLEFNDDLSEDTIVGYTIQSNFDNYAKLARKVTYYGFEGNYFKSKYDNGIDPENLGTGWLFKAELEIDTSTNVVPSLVVLFGTDPNEVDKHNDCVVFTKNGQKMLYAGVADDNGSVLNAGMGRGYIYVFSYEMAYSTTGSKEADAKYPDKASGYSTWNTTEGHGGKPALVLRSPYKLAPKTLPTFQTYPWDCPDYQVLQIKYRYIDPDGLIRHETGGKNNSIFTVNGVPSTVSVGSDACKLFDDSCGWEIAELTNVTGVFDKTADAYVATIGMSGDPYCLDYDISKYGIEDEISKIVVYKTAWDNKGEAMFDTSQMTLSIDASDSQINSNYVYVKLTMNSNNNKNKLENLVGVIMKFTATKEGQETKEFDVFCEFEQTSNGLIAKVPLSKFADYLTYTLTYKAQVVYDTGYFGWKYVETESSTYCALQRFEGLSFGQYITKSANSLQIIDSDYGINSYFKLTQSTYKDDGDDTIHMLYVGAFSASSRTRFTYKYNDRGLVYENSDSSGIIAKILKTMEIPTECIKQTPTGKSFKINSIIPTATAPSISTQMTTAYIYSMNINGAEQIKVNAGDGKRYVRVELYEVLNAYNDLSDPVNYDVQVHYNSSTGKYYLNSWEIRGLKSDQDYIVKFKVLTDGSAGKYLSVIDENSTSGTALQKRFSTKKNIDIRNVSLQYTNVDYNNKSYELSYYISQTTDIDIEYSILRYEDNDGVKGFNDYLSYEDLIDKGIITAREFDTYSEITTKQFKITKDNNPFTPGEQYLIQIKIYTAEEHDMVSNEEEGQISFDFPVNQTPTTNIKTSPTYNKTLDDEKIYGIAFEVTAMSDTGKIVMGPDNGSYIVRIYKNSGASGYTLLEDSAEIDLIYKDGDDEIPYSLSGLYATVFPSVSGTPSFILRGLESSTQYKICVYAAIDQNFNGKNDYLEGVDKYADYLNLNMVDLMNEYASVFNSDAELRDYYLVTEKPTLTADESGLCIDYVSSKFYAFNPNMIQLQYFDSTGVMKINKVIISIIHESGTPALAARDGLITGQDCLDLFSYNEAQNAYTMSIPTSKFAATKTGAYTISVNHYIIEGSTERLVYSYSGKLVKE